ncbi:phospholipid scramblase 2-like protein [Leptotrombidium deliense]|uniref:Phospholipid scramblase n=1 Tax=Leptotrombidium deliense TaxID=299467 RepID=A0A443SUB4_9ACAR|nr:phospholipid scramblase 2-like protein [Leptotrombidium deliense]
MSENMTAPADINLMAMQLPVQTQPQANAMMGMPAHQQDIPPGLAYLTNVSEVLVQQQVDLLEVFSGYETNNKYVVKNAANQQIYFAAEVNLELFLELKENDACHRWCCGPIRPFQMKIMDNTGLEVMRLHRPYRCTSCWFPCCLQKIEVFAPPGTLVGYVKQNWSICGPSFSVQNAAEETLYKISGPCCTCGCVCCRDVKFTLIDKKSGDDIGKIVKQWSGVVQEGYTDADNFSVQFPQTIEVKMKAVLLAACFLISNPRNKKKEELRPTEMA